MAPVMNSIFSSTTRPQKQKTIAIRRMEGEGVLERTVSLLAVCVGRSDTRSSEGILDSMRQ